MDLGFCIKVLRRSLYVNPSDTGIDLQRGTGFNLATVILPQYLNFKSYYQVRSKEQITEPLTSEFTNDLTAQMCHWEIFAVLFVWLCLWGHCWWAFFFFFFFLHQHDAMPWFVSFLTKLKKTSLTIILTHTRHIFLSHTAYYFQRLI